MDEQGKRSLAPNIGKSIFLMVVATIAALLNVAALTPLHSNGALQYSLTTLTLAPLVYGWWRVGRSWHQGFASLAPLSPVMLSIPIMSALSRYLLDFVEKRPREEIGVTPLMLLGFVLFCLLITVVAFFLLGDRAHSPAPGRKPR